MAAIPRSPRAQSPGGALNSTCVRPFAVSWSASTWAGCSYGNRYSTAWKPSCAAAAKRSRNGSSVYIRLRLAAKRGMETVQSTKAEVEEAKGGGRRIATTRSGRRRGGTPGGVVLRPDERTTQRHRLRDAIERRLRHAGAGHPHPAVVGQAGQDGPV